MSEADEAGSDEVLDSPGLRPTDGDLQPLSLRLHGLDGADLLEGYVGIRGTYHGVTIIASGGGDEEQVMYLDGGKARALRDWLRGAERYGHI